MNLFSWLLFAALSNAEEENVALQLRILGDISVEKDTGDTVHLSIDSGGDTDNYPLPPPPPHYSVGQYKAKTATVMETEPTCQNNGSPVPTVTSCEEYAKSVGQSFQIGDLPNYPRGCSHRQNHPSYAGVWWNTDQTGDWDQHREFTGEVALVCISPEPIATCNDRYVEALSAYWEFRNCGHFGNDYNKQLCGGNHAGECPEFWTKPVDSSYIFFTEAEVKYPGISEEMKCVKAKRKSFDKSPAFTKGRQALRKFFKAGKKRNYAEAISFKSAGCHTDCHYLWHAQYECVEKATL